MISIPGSLSAYLACCVQSLRLSSLRMVERKNNSPATTSSPGSFESGPNLKETAVWTKALWSGGGVVLMLQQEE